MTNYPLAPPRSCDVLMKGGITSGVIYPSAVCELASQYKLASVGGSSAGAIAAAAAAAAELGRAADGFGKLERLPADLMAHARGGPSLLFRLFQPQRGTAGLYKVFTAGLGKSGYGRWVRTALAALSAFAVWALIGALPGVVLLVLGIIGQGVASWAAVIAGAFVVLVGVVAAVAAGMLRSLAKNVPENNFGLCNGMAGKADGGAEPLTSWLHAKLQDFAGRPQGADPITFGQLTAGGVELRMMTTNLTRHQPMRMPWPEKEYFFDPDEFTTLFPAEVVDWMRKNPPPLPSQPAKRWDSELRRLQALPKLPFPLAGDVPVIVATRMSLSFPLLISAVPLYAVDFTHPDHEKVSAALSEWRHEHPQATPQDAAGVVPAPNFEVNWFSDGGIASNLPVHFFDSPLPARPTFAVDLAPFPPGVKKAANEADNTRLPVVNQGGLNRRWTRWQGSGLRLVAMFGRSILDTARGWVDEAQLVMPGYRDRIVTIYHDHTEGGMNLTMKDRVVTDLVERGQEGAKKLVTRFVLGNGWDNHRWIRFRTATAGLDTWLAGFQHGYDEPSPGALPYADLAGPHATAALPSYSINGGQRQAVNLRTDALLTLASNWQKPPANAFTQGSPSPHPVLRLVPGTLFDPIKP